MLSLSHLPPEPRQLVRIATAHAVHHELLTVRPGWCVTDLCIACEERGETGPFLAACVQSDPVCWLTPPPLPLPRYAWGGSYPVVPLRCDRVAYTLQQREKF